ncbi:hypothetical protein ACHAXH_006431, partial [Discostella pseudostelligera]
MNETFIEADANEPLKDTGGSTANVLFYPGVNSTVYIANVGDSTTLIVSYCKTKRKSTVVYQNRKHKPHLPDERQRIENAGGIVRIPQSLLRGDGSINGSIQETSRVIIPDKNGNPFHSLALAMSRSIGDFEGKRIGLTAEPEIDVWDVNDWKRQFDTDQVLDTVFFAITASDGLFDVLSPENVAEYIGQTLFDDRQSHESPLEACERLIREASRLWKKESIGMQYRDDISIVLSR